MQFDRWNGIMNIICYDNIELHIRKQNIWLFQDIQLVNVKYLINRLLKKCQLTRVRCGSWQTILQMLWKGISHLLFIYCSHIFMNIREKYTHWRALDMGVMRIWAGFTIGQCHSATDTRQIIPSCKCFATSFSYTKNICRVPVNIYTNAAIAVDFTPVLTN